MSSRFDDISRIAASSLPRRQALKLILGALAGTSLYTLEVRLKTGQVAEARDLLAPNDTCSVAGLTCAISDAAGCARSCDGRCKVIGPKCVAGFGVDAVCECITAIELAQYTTSVNGAKVQLAWQTATELDTAGFNVYRATKQDGPYVRLNDSIILAQGNATSGSSYTFADLPGKGDFFYKLEDISTQGESTLHESIAVHVGQAPFNLSLPLIGRQ